MSTTEKKHTGVDPSECVPDTETLLLARLKSSTSADDYFRWLLFVVGFYRSVNKIEAATELLRQFIGESKNADQSAHCYLALGQIATDEQHYQAALDHFTLALNLTPTKRKVVYVLHNNIGYCLNSLGRFVEGEAHCRRAIEIDWTRASGYRNLGVGLLGQKNVTAAAWALTEAVRAEPGDGRARLLLEKLLALHPSLTVQCPWIAQSLSDENPHAETLLV
jgi:tetratricopeptide (TPR) repeat protein